MKINEFLEELAQIENFYQKEITEEQKQIWYRELKHLNIERFKYIISQIYRTYKYTPKLADIIEINSNIGYTQTKDEKQIKCNKCKGTGYLIYKKQIQNGTKKLESEYGAICTCREKQKYEGWKITDERYRSNYYTPYVEKVGIY